MELNLSEIVNETVIVKDRCDIVTFRSMTSSTIKDHTEKWLYKTLTDGPQTLNEAIFMN